MSFKRIIFGLFILISSSSSLYGQKKLDISGDLSGAWRLTYSHDNQHFQNDFIAIKSNYQTNKDLDYYSIQGGELLGSKVIGFSVSKVGKHFRIVWFRISSPNNEKVKGSRLDGEFNYIVKVESSHLSLGDDVNPKDKQEYIRMTRLVPFKKAK